MGRGECREFLKKLLRFLTETTIRLDCKGKKSRIGIMNTCTEGVIIIIIVSVIIVVIIIIIIIIVIIIIIIIVVIIVIITDNVSLTHITQHLLVFISFFLRFVFGRTKSVLSKGLIDIRWCSRMYDSGIKKYGFIVK